MYSADIKNLELKYADSRSISGFRRHVLYSKHEYGVLAGDFSSRTRFGFIVHKPGSCNSLEKIRVEIRRVVSTFAEDGTRIRKLVGIDPSIMRRVIDTMEGTAWDIKQAFVVEGDVAYFRGYWREVPYNSMAYVLACTYAGKFLDYYGDALATILLGNPKVNTISDAREVNDLIVSVDAFSKEMQDEVEWGTTKFKIENGQHKYNAIKEKMSKLEDDMNYTYGEVQDCLDILAEYGIDEKDIEFT